ncbi:type IV toxin-antitoxin system AbiEi family antitoxin domain-containing protein, partial [bacterium]|nr:type IV toxin-antitoxin system AbiEi family antitoxin domain-containing protein [bacterium]
MNTKTELLIKFFEKHGGILRFSSILKAGFHRDTISFLEKEGEIEKIARGLYRKTGYISESYPDLILASLQAARGVICLVSALYFYEVTTEIPRVVDLAIPEKTHSNRIKYPPVKFYRFSYKTWDSGIEYHLIDGYQIPIYSLAKTIVDCFKFRNRIGINVVREALKTAIEQNKVKPADIMKYAKICRMTKVIKPIL